MALADGELRLEWPGAGLTASKADAHFPGLERAIAIVRVALLLALSGVLLGARNIGGTLFRRGAKAAAPAAAILILLSFAGKANAQTPVEIPDQANA